LYVQVHNIKGKDKTEIKEVTTERKEEKEFIQNFFDVPIDDKQYVASLNKGLQSFKNQLESSIKDQGKKKEFRRACVAIEKLIRFFETSNKEERVTLLKSNERVGVLFICSYINFMYKNFDIPQLCLEFDCRGILDIKYDTNTNYFYSTIDIGEIKMAVEGNAAHAKEQLCLRLRTMKFVLTLLMKKYCPEGTNMSITLVGRIFHGSKNSNQRQEVITSPNFPGESIHICYEYT